MDIFSSLFSGAITMCYYILYIIVAVTVSLYIYNDSKKFKGALFLGIKPFWWGIFSLAAPAHVMIAYWLFHYSNFKYDKQHEISTNCDK